jgi:hypothetical protein
MRASDLVSVKDLPRPTEKHFYRYGRISDGRMKWLERVILEHRIYIPKASELNDPRDCRPQVKRSPREAYVQFLEREATLSRSELQRLFVHVMSASEDRLRERTTDALHRRLSATRVYSMATRWDNLAMWGLYSDSSRGY